MKKALFPSNPNLDLKEFTNSYLEILSKSMEDIDPAEMYEVFESLLESIKKGVMIYTCGNGGSSAIAEHIVCDFMKGASTDSTVRPKVVPLLSTPTLTAIANDLSYDEVFSYQLSKLGKENDVLMSVSSSGNSQNIVQAIMQAKALKMKTISFVGFDGGEVKDISDYALHVKCDNYGICEDAHHILMHIFAQYTRLRSIDDATKVGNIKF